MTQPIILCLNGPNLNMLGVREPELYGRSTLADVEAAVRRKAEPLGLDIDFRQSNHEGELVTWIQEAHGNISGVIINPAAYTHTSIAIADALRILTVPIIELHFNNSYRYADRAFRQLSHVRPVATGVIFGFGAAGYINAVEAMYNILNPPFEKA
ncbi:3-dehydroquinate dehydratase (plasmid) [Sinorhizobium meliloti WSM1022]|uniref:type II 3-dehydroquinate dehydratase n=1 Tax=Rhizobium meliloti TaxID=382 RepID=UPI0004252086|nr:type II 3-dehydroquinate dehydratase [Sinorhizobium meliloti]MDE3819676.1 3-dehydroquinate dehydratase [Sinorhizobium meliloti]MDE3831390.1 3-dehydroquinate dehydratase [Sinorhizobium meliloti]MDE4579073.1 3-dehydroquinate dehydratase [Sinorhizobium meliloti]MDW9627773.1 type II 3-dehydroquinate dehydratase [Sinorhizobium meliloti]MDW9714057.1 type II 3-dehydroquinate dehydratase [Sinorhizobium meliloti]